MAPTFDAKGDAMPSEFFGIIPRKKLIHSVGAVGKVIFKPSGETPYTGIFKGANFGVIRLSSAAEPSKTLTPGMGLKFLRDGIDSANLVAMNSVNG